MNIPALRAFVCAARESSFSRAADQLHLTQPGLSKRIAGLEDSLRVQLFDRIGRRTVLTEAGRTFLPFALRILNEADQAGQALKALQPAQTGRLYLATTQHIGLYYLKPLLGEFVRHYPGIDIEVDFKTSVESHRLLSAGELELGFMSEPPLHEQSLEYIPVLDERLCFAVSANHVLALQPEVTLHDLTLHPALLPGPNTRFRRLIENLFSEQGLALDVRQPSNYLEALRMLAETGLGWSALPLVMITPELVRLPLQSYEPSRTIMLAYHRKVSLSGPARLFLDWVREHGLTQPEPTPD
ncbi:LysR family transcriptional regulator [Crenobacter sp. SG2305]|uniref:LysR family transcriptional regulator n=1 Tax=Crenobacter oryzisoli TaxID=3056844 RepID=UPI0025AA78FE|nr:LysR family transcriptional regulator [Crenobacter sp. SG2305]MDN0082744.1 LysR family transcriptional regulator [Crenobacter sp. SG2305]